MPELPEVEAIRRGIAPALVGKRLQGVELYGARVARHHDNPTDLAQAVTGRRIEAVARRGKFMWLELAGGQGLVIHLGMSGQLRLGEGGEPRHLRARLLLEGGGELRFLDQRTFGYLRAAPLVPVPDAAPAGWGTASAALPAPVSHIARDVLDPALDRAVVAARVGASAAGIKRLLLDQEVVSGVGNIYADETLWQRGLHPATPGRALDSAAVSGLLDAAGEVMRRSLKCGGTSFDQLYVDATGTSGYFAIQLAAYGRDGQACQRCGATLYRVVYAGRSAHLCPVCQPEPALGPAEAAAGRYETRLTGAAR